MNIAENLRLLNHSIPVNVQLIVVSKTQSIETLTKVYEAGHKVFAENKVQELLTKAAALPSDIQWHFIGHLQTNKVRLIVPFIHMIQSIDSMKLLKEVEKEAGKIGHIIPCLLQMHIASEETKFGLDHGELIEILDSPGFRDMKHIRIDGLMGMATFTNNVAVVKQEFRTLKETFDEIKANFFSQCSDFSQLSMGMSGDYKLAIEQGSTMVRIGTAIFGERIKSLNSLS